MKSVFFISLLALLLFALSCENQAHVMEESAMDMTHSEKIERGKYLVESIGCDDCHSPKTLGPYGPEIIDSLRFSGYPADRPFQPYDKINLQQGWTLFNPDLTSSVGPWGQSFASNITSDETGIGNWAEENFIRAMREGLYKGIEGSRPILPPMPWFAYKNLSDNDLKSIFAYLKTTKPVHNIVPAPIPPTEL